MTQHVSRRSLLKGGTAAFIVAATADLSLISVAEAAGPAHPAPVAPNPLPFVRISADNTVTVVVKHLDKGQGIATGLATIVAEELDADWSQMRSAFAPADNRVYNNLLWGPAQGTGGSTAIANSWDQLRKAGAAARAMLVAEAASRWNVPAAAITVEKGVVRHAASNRQASFGELAAGAAQRAVPQTVTLKDPKDFKLIGTKVQRLDSIEKSTGKTVFSIDVRRPGQLTAVVAHAPKFGAVVRSFDATEARKVKGVRDIVQIPSGVAVVADDTWSAMKGRDALKVVWDESKAETRSSDAIMAGYKRLAGTPGISAAKRGEPAAGFGKATRFVEADFEFPYLAHAAMEPMNGVIAMNADGTADVWAGCQIQTIEQIVVSQVLGIAPAKVNLNTLWAGGSFGRRATPSADYLAECAQIVKATGGRAPIHLHWTREDDMTSGYFRPMFLHRVRAGLDAQGNIAGWQHRIVGKSILIGTPFEAMLVKDGVDATSVEGISDTAYAIPDFACEVHNAREPVPVLWWRSVGHTHTAQVIESVMDELAHIAGQDPLAFRMKYLTGAPREQAVLKLAAEKAGWGQAMPKGKGRGIAVHKSFNSYVAMVADVTVEGANLKVDRIVAAVDCGIAVNPDVVAAQVEGAVGFALYTVLRGKITLKDGAVVETNFDTYEPTRMTDMPKVEVHIVASNEAPTGIGEPGVPPLAPAISNAVFAATGRRLRSLPLDLASLRGA
jgi:isoquinoline 1-oxidoreductase subunit beta